MGVVASLQVVCFQALSSTATVGLAQQETELAAARLAAAKATEDADVGPLGFQLDAVGWSWRSEVALNNSKHNYCRDNLLILSNEDVKVGKATCLAARL